MSFQAEEQPFILALRNTDAMLGYELAVADYYYGGGRAALYRALFALGISRNECCWHAEHPGQSRVCVYID
jgi:hypothetical protein